MFFVRLTKCFLRVFVVFLSTKLLCLCFGLSCQTNMVFYVFRFPSDYTGFLLFFSFEDAQAVQLSSYLTLEPASVLFGTFLPLRLGGRLSLCVALVVQITLWLQVPLAIRDNGLLCVDVLRPFLFQSVLENVFFL